MGAYHLFFLSNFLLLVFASDPGASGLGLGPHNALVTCFGEQKAENPKEVLPASGESEHPGYP